jgi:uncharacterized protein YjbJ (UPF0337 family)
MNEDVLQGRWKQVKGRLRSWWGKLTDDDVTRINGSMQTLLGILQERYGYTREHAQKEIDEHLREFQAVVQPGMSR